MFIRERRMAGGSRIRRGREPRAATLIELLVVIALIGLLISILVPSLKRSMDLAGATLCKHNLHEIHRSLVMYQSDHDGWLPIVVEPKLGLAAIRRPDPWFLKMYPTSMPDPFVLTCPKDPYRYRMVAGGSHFEEDVRADYSSYGLNAFIMMAGDGVVANLDHHQPSRPGDTILLADIGPDLASFGSQVAGLVGPARNHSLLTWDDGFDPFSGQTVQPWLTQRHEDGIHVLTVAGGVRKARTADVMRSPVRRHYSDCAAGGCTFCREFRAFHYSFASSHLYWWTGPAPAE